VRIGAWLLPPDRAFTVTVGFAVLGVLALVGAEVVEGAETPKEPQYGVGGHGVEGESKIYGDMARRLSGSDDMAIDSFFDFMDMEFEFAYMLSLLRSGCCNKRGSFRLHCASLRGFP